MGSELLRSFLLLLVFWWVVALLYFGLQDPEANLETLKSLQVFYGHYLNLEVPEDASVLNAWAIQLKVVYYWTLPILAVVGIMFLLGVGAGLLRLLRAHQALARRDGTRLSLRFLESLPKDVQKMAPVDALKRRIEASIPTDDWRGLSVTLGPSPRTYVPKMEMLGVDSSFKSIYPLYKAMPEALQNLTDEILSYLAAHPNAYVGDGHGEITLLEHTLNVMNTLARMPEATPIIIPVIAAHDMGKITSFKKVGPRWESVRLHDRESARLVGTLPSWEDLEPDLQKILQVAIRHSHSKWKIPKNYLSSGEFEMVTYLIDIMHAADGQATANEKKEVLGKMENLGEVLMNALFQALPLLPIYGHTVSSAGGGGAGWVKNKRLYLIEQRIREEAVNYLEPQVAAAINGKYRRASEIHPFTQRLLEELNNRGWLLTEHGDMKIRDAWRALWNIEAGTKKFNGVIILDLPEEYLNLLPRNDTRYDMKILAVNGQPPAELTVTDSFADSLFAPGEVAEAKGATKKRAAEVAKDHIKSRPIDPATLQAAKDLTQEEQKALEQEPRVDAKPTPENAGEATTGAVAASITPASTEDSGALPETEKISSATLEMTQAIMSSSSMSRKKRRTISPAKNAPQPALKKDWKAVQEAKKEGKLKQAKAKPEQPRGPASNAEAACMPPGSQDHTPKNHQKTVDLGKPPGDPQGKPLFVGPPCPPGLRKVDRKPAGDGQPPPKPKPSTDKPAPRPKAVPENRKPEAQPSNPLSTSKPCLSVGEGKGSDAKAILKESDSDRAPAQDTHSPGKSARGGSEARAKASAPETKVAEASSSGDKGSPGRSKPEASKQSAPPATPRPGLLDNEELNRQADKPLVSHGKRRPGKGGLEETPLASAKGPRPRRRRKPRSKN